MGFIPGLLGGMESSLAPNTSQEQCAEVLFWLGSLSWIQSLETPLFAFSNMLAKFSFDKVFKVVPVQFVVLFVKDYTLSITDRYHELGHPPTRTTIRPFRCASNTLALFTFSPIVPPALIEPDQLDYICVQN